MKNTYDRSVTLCTLACCLLLAMGSTIMGCGAETQARRARKAMERKDWPAAEVSWQKALIQRPDDVQFLYGLGWTYHLSRQELQAKALFDSCVRLAPESHLGYKGLGSVALAEGNLSEAEAQLERALSFSPDDPAILNSLALTRMRGGRLDEALGLFERLSVEHPDLLEPAVGHAEALLRAGRSPEALVILDSILASGDREPHELAILYQTRARVLLDRSTGRVDRDRCTETALPVLVWLDEADADLRRAEETRIDVPEIPAIRRMISRKRTIIGELCPGMPRAGKGDSSR